LFGHTRLVSDSGDYLMMIKLGETGGIADLPGRNGITLSQNYPNPFTESTLIKYTLPFHSVVTLKVFDLSGKEVAVVFSKEQQSGSYNYLFDGKEFPAGVYYYQLRTGRDCISKKMVFVK
jgi:hypothetical protein